MIDKTGVYNDVSESAYHADPCPEPSLSSGIIKILNTRSPRHAWQAHPRLNSMYRETHKTAYDIGHAAHALRLHDDRGIVIIDAKSYQTNDAKAQRDQAYIDGKVPVLTGKMAQLEAMHVAGNLQLDAHADARGAFKNGTPEATLVWKESTDHGIHLWCRARLDWLPNAPGAETIFHDFKTTTNASPQGWGERVMYDTGADIQAAWYRRGIRAVFGIDDPNFRFVVQEHEPPYALCVIGVTPAAIGMADRKIARAINTWLQCRASDNWPGYPAETVFVDPPVWHEKRWLESEASESILRDTRGASMHDIMNKWQAP